MDNWNNKAWAIIYYQNLYDFQLISPPPPPVGTDLPVCNIDSDQCCTVNYIESIQDKAQRRLEKFLRKEFEDVIDNY